MKIGRNDPCHCGSGNKYKKCCSSKDEAANHSEIAAQAAAKAAELAARVAEEEAEAKKAAVANPGKPSATVSGSHHAGAVKPAPKPKDMGRPAPTLVRKHAV